MKITDFEKLIQQMPIEHQAFDVKFDIWDSSSQSKTINNIFKYNDTISISRNELLRLNGNVEENVLKVLMWGYPSKGRGKNIDNFLKPENFTGFVEKLKDAEKLNNISMMKVYDMLNTKGLKLSTLSKILYFFHIEVESFSALILDLRVINALNSGRFKDSGIEQFKNLRYDNVPQKYIHYLKFMHSLAKDMKTNADKVEMFLYEFGSNLKEITTEKVFEILGEGGGIRISRQINKSGAKFIYHHNESDPTDEGLDINSKNEYDNFEQPFQLINDRYPWFLLNLMVHDDYKNFIIERLIEKLNHKSALLENFEYHKGDLENILKIKLNHTINKHTNELTWSYEKIK
jgi:hypothetical protein